MSPCVCRHCRSNCSQLEATDIQTLELHKGATGVLVTLAFSGVIGRVVVGSVTSITANAKYSVCLNVHFSLCFFADGGYCGSADFDKEQPMPINNELNEEIRILTLFNLDSARAGIKAHKAADPVALAAIERLYQKGLVTQSDGGYLTDMGINCAEHLQTALAILNPPSFAV